MFGVLLYVCHRIKNLLTEFEASGIAMQKPTPTPPSPPVRMQSDTK